MKKYAIVKKTRILYESYDAHRYNLLFKIFGPTYITYVTSAGNVDDCKASLRDRITKPKYEVIEIVEM